MKKRNEDNENKEDRRDRDNDNDRNNDKFNKKRKIDDDENEKLDYIKLVYSSFRAVSLDFSLMIITAFAVIVLLTFSFVNVWILNFDCT